MVKTSMLRCEWNGCKLNVCNTQFSKHLLRHLTDSDDAGVCKAASDAAVGAGVMRRCLWLGCEFRSCDDAHLRRHVLFHCYHANIKRAGRIALAARAVPQCQMSVSAVNVIPDLSQPFRCEWDGCGMQLEDAEMFYGHVRHHLKCYYSADQFRTKQVQEYLCLWADCGQVLSSYITLVAHSLKHTMERVCACPHCGALFSSRAKFYEHRLRQAPVDEREHQCSHCLKRFASTVLLHEHIRSHINTHRCSVCGITCLRASHLKRHMQYRHQDVRPFPCVHCDFRFKSQFTLRRHVEAVHNMSELVSCPQPDCSYFAWNKFNVQRHLKTCQYATAQRTGGMYHCHLCDSQYRTGCGLTRHLKDKHDIRLPQGHMRFSYKRGADDNFRLVTLRYESLDVANQVLTVPPSEQQPQPRPRCRQQPRQLQQYHQQQQQRKRRRLKSSSETACDGVDAPAAEFMSPHLLPASQSMTSDAAAAASAVPDVLSLTCVDRDPPDFITSDDGRRLALPASVRHQLAAGRQVLVCVQHDQVQLLTRADVADDVVEKSDFGDDEDCVDNPVLQNASVPLLET